jgi:flagellar motility protein MotE (MotC chaperone)
MVSTMFSLFSRVRFLPITIFALVLMLTVKVSDVWEGIEGLTDDTVNVAGAAAQTEEGTEPQSLTATDGSGLLAPGEGEDFSEDFDPFSLDENAIDAEADRLVNQDPTLLTQQEIELLQLLAARRDELDRQAQELEQRTGLLQAAEERIDNKVKQMRAFQQTIEGLIKTYDEQQLAKVISLVKIYENMKPKDAARIFEELEMDTLLLVAERMKERKLAVVMANMNPTKARDVTVELSRLRNIPEAGSTGGG